MSNPEVPVKSADSAKDQPQVSEYFLRQGVSESRKNKPNRGSKLAACVLLETAFQPAFSLFCFFFSLLADLISLQISRQLLRFPFDYTLNQHPITTTP